jgi:hypothetical protein
LKAYELTLKQSMEGLKNKAFSSMELTQSLLSRISEKETLVSALNCVCEESALEQAAIAELAAVFTNSPVNRYGLHLSLHSYLRSSDCIQKLPSKSGYLGKRMGWL